MEYCINGNLKAFLSSKRLLHDQQEAEYLELQDISRLEMQTRKLEDPMRLKKICIDVS